MPELAAMSGRSLRHARRNAESLLTALLLPVLLMLLFVGLFGGAIETDGRYVDYVVPGVILLCVGFGSSLAAAAVAQDLASGTDDRFRATDVPGAAVLGGHVVAAVARNALSTTLVVAVALLIGFSPSASVGEWLAAITLLTLFALAIAWVSAAIGVLVSTPEGANGFTFVVAFLPYVSGAFVPIDTLPGWLQPVAEHQPITPVVEAVRALLLGAPVGDAALTAIAWSGGLALGAAALATHLYRR